VKRVFILAAAIGGLLATTALAEETVAEIISDLGLKEDTKPVRDYAGWQKPKTVVVVVDSPARLTWLQEVAPGVKLVPAANAEAALPLMKDADAVMNVGCNPAIVNAARKARWIHGANAGVEGCRGLPALTSGKILLTNMQRVNGGTMAETVIALMFGLTRGIGEFAKATEREEWNGRLVPFNKMWEIKGRTMLVAGLGGIGTEVARRAHALGMNVIATRGSGTGGPDFVSKVGKAEDLATFAAEADVVVGSLPLTPETKGVFNKALFDRMKKGTIFINVGRGESVVQDDLIAALDSGQLGGAGLDVTSPEPLPKGHPLWKAKNVIITSHTSSYSEQRNDRVWQVTREQLRRYVAGEKMLSVVDAQRGY
jgi:phosphoglycerate dehydrogenase-like enzyme